MAPVERYTLPTADRRVASDVNGGRAVGVGKKKVNLVSPTRTVFSETVAQCSWRPRGSRARAQSALAPM